MRGFEVFYPMGWDDNGLPTERRCRTTSACAANRRCTTTRIFNGSEEPGGRTRRPSPGISWSCASASPVEDEGVRGPLAAAGPVGRLEPHYQTIDERARGRQRAFLRNLARGEAYQAEAPTLWDVTFRTAVAQAELEDRERPGAYHRVGSTTTADDRAFIETTRPELLAACVALVAHPDDERYQPLFGRPSPRRCSGSRSRGRPPLAEPDKGSGIAMICTFGDTTDVTWWRELHWTPRPIVGWDGRIIPGCRTGSRPETGRPRTRTRRGDHVHRQGADGRDAARIRRPRR